jgi:KDO2-lipid IV(A) lauroyltransferase
VKFFQSLPLGWVARIGRAGGGLAYWVDARHRRVAMENLTRCFGREKTPAEIRALARENFKRLGESYGCAIKTASMTWAQLESHLEFGGLEKLEHLRQMPVSVVVAIGHFGNFEVYTRANHLFPELQFATTYRALKEPGLNRLLIELRTNSGCLVFERRRESDALRTAMGNGHLILGLFSDQNAGTGGAWIPFCGHLCSTTTAPAVYAVRYKAPLYTSICYRIGLARWRIEVGDEIPTQRDGQRRSSEEIMLDVNQAFEAGVRRDPANWFWVHRRWKPRQTKVQRPKSKVAEGEALNR